MISIDRVYKTVLTLANSDIRGNVKPSDFDLFVNDAIEEIYEDYIFEINRLVNRENRGLINGGLENLPDRIREKLQHFLQDTTLTYLTSSFQLPADLKYFDSVYYNDVNEVEMCKNAKEFKLLANMSDRLVNETYPIYLRQGEIIKIVPATIVDNVSVFYLRKPLYAKWTYLVISGAEIFNPSANDFQDIDLHPSEYFTIIIKVAKRFGINLKEEDLKNIALQEESKEFNQENAS